jgi:hypothetical protein
MSAVDHTTVDHSAVEYSSTNGTTASSSPHICGMAMTFQVPYADTPILFDSVVPSNTGEFIGALIVIFFFAVLLRGLMILRVWLEMRYLSPLNKEAGEDGKPKFNLTTALIRAALTAVTVTLGYAVMLVTMTFVVVTSPLPKVMDR